MTTALLRHAHTSWSRRYLVNGNAATRVALDDEGIASCLAARHQYAPMTVQTWATSSFLRTQETARLLMGDEAATLVVLPELDELDYGVFEARPFLDYAAWLHEHGPHARVPDGSESQRAGIRRMLTGLVRALDLPSRRTVVCHGLLASFLHWQSERGTADPMPIYFDDVQPVVPRTWHDDDLRRLASAALDNLDEREVIDPGPFPPAWARAGQ
ncbi:histidine phosphatase family protein [Myceligenerans salitolerans]|uniref:Histidine phosphatase family protein n=1 Tax=Myceligenerans salitolerans TaxID=1230528 RepID=A0ABS3ICE8_9MICO|nr:histidine phosphatase family protein [Myceligenerans salitolerans]MBO0610699.1 histidine phosphatase family protein [Myceligenerans salitolerans]